MSKRKRSLQPFLIVVAITLSDIEEVYICLDKTFYKLPSTIEALNTLFQIFYVLDTFFPPESSHLWHIIERAVYGIKPQAGEHIENCTIEVVSALEAKRAARTEPVSQDEGTEQTQSSEDINPQQSNNNSRIGESQHSSPESSHE